MKLYAVIILIGCIFTSILAVSVGNAIYQVSYGAVLLSILFSLLFLVFVDALVAIIVRLLPKKWVNPFNKIYTVHKWESKLYVKFGIRKWKDLIPAHTPIPTPTDSAYTDKCGVFEGGGYISKGIYRPMNHCMMRDYAPFCPACTRAIERMIRYYCDEGE